MEELQKQEEARNDVMLTMFYLNKLVECGFVEGGPRITMTGFDMAMDLKESGYVVAEQDVRKICEVYKFEPVNSFTLMIMDMQRLGLPVMLKMAEELNKEEDDGN